METPSWCSPRAIAREILRENEGYPRLWKAGETLLVAADQIERYGTTLQRRSHDGVMALMNRAPDPCRTRDELYDDYRELRRLSENVITFTKWLRNAVHRLRGSAEALRGIPLMGLAIAAEQAADPPQVIAKVVPVRSHTVYGLVSSEEPSRVRYVGQSVAPARRLDDHASGSSAPTVREWFTATLSAGHEVWMIRLAEVPPELASRVERDWITAYADRGMADLNLDRRRGLQRVA